MHRYFIDTDDDDTFVEDELGFMLEDAKAARSYALAVLPEMAMDRSQENDQWTCLAVVRDEAGAVIYRATLTLKGEWVKDAAR